MFWSTILFCGITAASAINQGVVGDYVANVLYPQDSGSEFNSTYYLEEQLPWIVELWRPFGLKGYQVAQLDASAPYSTLTTVFFDSQEQFNAAFEDSGEEIYARVPLFSNRDAVRWEGYVVASVSVDAN